MKPVSYDIEFSPNYEEIYILCINAATESHRGHCYALADITPASLGRLLRALPIKVGRLGEDIDVSGDFRYRWVSSEAARYRKLDRLYRPVALVTPDDDWCARHYFGARKDNGHAFAFAA